VRRLDQHGIDQACLMAVENPEELDYYFTTWQVLEACQRFPDRLIPFCAVDPRHRYPESFNPFPILEEYVNLGCRGFGELLAGVPIDHPCLQKIYAACGELGLPVLFHADHLICSDEAGAPRLEKILQTFPKTNFIGHATRFWAEISSRLILTLFAWHNIPQARFCQPAPPIVCWGNIQTCMATFRLVLAILLSLATRLLVWIFLSGIKINSCSARICFTQTNNYRW